MQHAGPSADLESLEMAPPVLENAVSSSSVVGGHRGALNRVSTSEQLDDAPLFRSVLSLMKLHTRPCLPQSVSPGLSSAAASEVTPHTEKHSHPLHPRHLSHLLLSDTWFYTKNPAAMSAPPKPPSMTFSIGRIFFIIYYGGSAQQMCTCTYGTKLILALQMAVKGSLIPQWARHPRTCLELQFQRTRPPFWLPQALHMCGAQIHTQSAKVRFVSLHTHTLPDVLALGM